MKSNNNDGNKYLRRCHLLVVTTSLFFFQSFFWGIVTHSCSYDQNGILAFPLNVYFVSKMKRLSLPMSSSLLNMNGSYNELLKSQEELTRTATHLIAIPLEENKEFMLELESVQRAVLYNCPQLVSAVITPSSTKLPLLVVNTRPDNGNGSDDDNLGRRSPKSGLPGFDATSSLAQRMAEEKVTEKINDIVSEVVQEYIYEREDQNGEIMTPDPIMIAFEGLEIEGSTEDVNVEHEVLYATGKEGKGCIDRLRSMVEKIRTVR